MRDVDDRLKERMMEFGKKMGRNKPRDIEVGRSQKGKYHTGVTMHFEDGKPPVTIDVHDMMLGHSADDTLGDQCENSFYSGALKNARDKGRK